MKVLCHPSSSSELAVVTSLLTAEGIRFFVHNEHYGALKVGPVIPLVNERSVLVAEEDFERASELLAAPPLPPEVRTRRGRPGPGSVLRMLVEVVLLGWLIPGGRGRRESR